MKASFARVATATIIAVVSGRAASHPSINVLTPDEITQAIKGKICTTSAGARFRFGEDGQYSYEGLWKNAGRYVIESGAVVIQFDSGLERSFSVSRRGNIFYMEETAISCR